MEAQVGMLVRRTGIHIFAQKNRCLTNTKKVVLFQQASFKPSFGVVLVCMIKACFNTSTVLGMLGVICHVDLYSHIYHMYDKKKKNI